MSYSVDWKDLISVFGYGFVNDLEQYKHIVKAWAYKDMQPRTIGGLREFRKNTGNSEKLNTLFDDLANDLYSFIINEPAKNKEEFDDWHKKECKNFINQFNTITGNNVDDISFGKAQKIINVSFKYIYCLKGADAYTDKFEHCHMVLDRYTYSEGFYKEEVMPSCNMQSSNLTSWSNLSPDEYYPIQDNIRRFLNGSDNKYKDAQGNPLTPFQAEFHIFEKYIH